MIAQYCISTYVPVRVCLKTSLHGGKILCLAETAESVVTDHLTWSCDCDQ